MSDYKSKLIDEIYKSISDRKKLEDDLITAINNNDEDTVHILLEKGIELNEEIFNKAYSKKNYRIIDLLFKYKTYKYIKYDKHDYIYDSYVKLIFDLNHIFNFGAMKYETDIQAEKIIDIAIDNYSKKNVLDKLIKYEQFNNGILEYIKYYDTKLYKSSMNVTPEMYESIKNVIKQRLFSLLFRSCALTKVAELRRKLRRLNIDKIDGKPIDDINSETELCDLIVTGLKVNVTKYDGFNYSITKPPVRDDDDDDDDDDSSTSDNDDESSFNSSTSVSDDDDE